MQSKQIRLRKEFLYQKEKAKESGKEKEKDKEAIKNTNFEAPKESLIKRDCEYSQLKYKDPQVLITTSRSPSARLKQFFKEIGFIFPNSTPMNRGAYKLKDIFDYAISRDISDVVILHEHQGEPDGMIISHLPVGPTLFIGITNTVLRHDVENQTSNLSLTYPHLIFNNFNDKTGERIKTIFQNLFPIPKDKSKRVLSFLSKEDFISFRHHTYEKPKFDTIELSEEGPRFEMRPYMIRMGNLLEKNATIEWCLKSFINSASKIKRISEK